MFMNAYNKFRLNYTFLNMSEAELISQLKFRIINLESNLSEKNKLLQEYKFIESQADTKIKGMQKIHAQKIKSLLNSIQILKKQKASIEGLSKQHKRSKLIQQLNKEILDQDLVIEILRQKIYKDHGKEEGRKVCDEIIVKALNKGPQRIRPVTREELRMEIQKLKEVNLNLEKKMKQGDKKGTGLRMDADETMSQISSMSSNESQLVQNKTEQMLNKIRALQIQLEGLKLESSSKNKIIQKLKTLVLDGEKHKSELELLKNQIEIANRKVFSYEKILKENKETTNKKIIDLYERELKVEQLEMVGQEKSEKLKSLNEKHGLLLQQIQAEKQQLQAKYEELKQENQKIILENISNKKYQQNQKNKIDQIRTVNNKQKSELEAKLKEYEAQAQRILDQNTKLQHQYVQLEAQLFSERGDWIEEKQKLVEELQVLRQNKIGTQQANQMLADIQRLRDENKRLHNIFGSGQISSNPGGSDKMLLERLQAYRRKVQYYENVVNKGEKSKEIQVYNELFQKYNKLMSEFQEYKANNYGVGGKNKRKDRKQIIPMNKKEKEEYDGLSSGVDQLNLADVDSEVLDNFDTSYEYSIHLDQYGKPTKLAKISPADQELLKMINSDLWYFIKDDELTKKIQQASALAQSQTDQQDNLRNFEQIRKLKNLSHPQGRKIKIYEEEVNQLDEMSDRVSITSAMAKEINQYDSDVNIEFDKFNNHIPKNLNPNKLKNLSSEIGSDVMVSSAQSGESNLKKKKKPLGEKASKLNLGVKQSVNSSQIQSELSEQLLNSDVSSVNISERQLNRIDSDVEIDFRKKKRR